MGATWVGNVASTRGGAWGWRKLGCGAWLLVGACAAAPPSAPSAAERPEAQETARALDDFEDLGPWQVQASDDVLARVEHVPGVAGQALRLHFDFRGHSGYASVRRALPLRLPAHYAFTFELRGAAPVNDLQLKLADESGDNVWWFRRLDLEVPAQFQQIKAKQRQIEFAWGPTRSRELEQTASVEFVISAGRDGGSGYVDLDRLTLHALPSPPSTLPVPIASASSSAPGGAPALAVDGRADSAWHSAPERGAEQWLQLDLGRLREFGGLLLRWTPGAGASRYDIELSRDGVRFEHAAAVLAGNGGEDALRLPESEARYVRLALHAGAGSGYGLAELELRDLTFGATPNAFVTALAREAPRGRYPRGFSGEQPYWTLLAADGAATSGLISEDGALELAPGGFSVEPFVVMDGQPISWADVTIEHTLAEGALPIPRVSWRHRAFVLEIESFAAGDAAHSTLWARYTLSNRQEAPLSLALVLALRPLQVNPPGQFLNIAGGVSPIRALRWDGATLSVNEAPALQLLRSPDHVELARFEAGGFPEGPVPARGAAAQVVEDASGLASGALVYALRLAPGQHVTLGLRAPLAPRPDAQAQLGGPRESADLPELEAQRTATLGRWREQLERVAFRVPPEAQPVVDSLRSALAHILMSRAGPVLRPGTRSYARSWIRDGAMMAESLLRLGHSEVAREYLSWFAPFQFENGKVPCCVDRRGADPVVENDSAGEFIFLVAEVFRFTRDRALLTAMWPHVEAAARYLETLRQSQRTPDNLTPARRAFYGLMPPSISHEGYSDKPAYSYWDDFWAQIGYEDAVAIAEALGNEQARARLVEQRDEFQRELGASVEASASLHGVRYVPGSADRGDFDATSTTIALSPGRAGAELPEDLLRATFERYFEEFQARRDGKRSWEDYTPYELRVVGSFVRLGARARAHELLAFFFRDQRPRGWNQWAEVVGREPRKPRFIGDMPHAWIASDYIRSALDLFAYTRRRAQQLVLTAGIPPSWFEGPGIAVERLRTPYGTLHYSARAQGKQLALEVRGDAPPGGFALPWPWDGAPGRARVNGKEARFEGRELRFSGTPARVVIERP